jgi:hypothetical protein
MAEAYYTSPPYYAPAITVTFTPVEHLSVSVFEDRDWATEVGAGLYEDIYTDMLEYVFNFHLPWPVMIVACVIACIVMHMMLDAFFDGVRELASQATDWLLDSAPPFLRDWIDALRVDETTDSAAARRNNNSGNNTRRAVGPQWTPSPDWPLGRFLDHLCWGVAGPALAMLLQAVPMLVDGIVLLCVGAYAIVNVALVRAIFSPVQQQRSAAWEAQPTEIRRVAQPSLPAKAPVVKKVRFAVPDSPEPSTMIVDHRISRSSRSRSSDALTRASAITSAIMVHAEQDLCNACVQQRYRNNGEGDRCL